MKRVLYLTTLLAVLVAFSSCSIADKFLPETVKNKNNNSSNAEKGETSSKIDTLPIFDSVMLPDLEIVREEERDDDYLKDALFIGDSICLGISVYGGINPSQTLAISGLSTKDLYTRYFDYQGGSYPLLEAVKMEQPKYVYIWIGVNDVKILSKEDYVTNMKTLVNNVRVVSPDSKICVLSIAPISQYHEWNANNTIYDYTKTAGTEILNLGMENVFFLDMWPVLRNDSWALNEAFSSGDGLHLNSYAYTKVLGYLSRYKLG